MIVDAHAHFVPLPLLETLRTEKRLFPSVKVEADGGATRLAFMDGPLTRPVSPKLSDVGARQQWLGDAGIDTQVVGGWLDMFGYELPPEEAADWCRFLNEQMKGGTAEHGFLAPLACVPLQSGKLAAEILEEALGQGFHGTMIGTQPKGEGGNLDDPDLNPFWEVASAKAATIFVHPMFVCGDERVNDYDMVNAVGRVADTTIAVARLLFSGHLTRYPGVKLIVSHGGAALPFALGRLKRNHAIHPEHGDPLPEFQRLYFDTVMFEALALRYLCDVAGADKVMLGSDHPFPIGDPDPVKLIDETELTQAERKGILGNTAMELFHLDCDCH
ncbi:MAG: amidohydrolase family protein [Alphaproteobacteria bacterium]